MESPKMDPFFLVMFEVLINPAMHCHFILLSVLFIYKYQSN